MGPTPHSHMHTPHTRTRTRAASTRWRCHTEEGLPRDRHVDVLDVAEFSLLDLAGEKLDVDIHSIQLEGRWWGVVVLDGLGPMISAVRLEPAQGRQGHSQHPAAATDATAGASHSVSILYLGAERRQFVRRFFSHPFAPNGAKTLNQNGGACQLPISFIL